MIRSFEAVSVELILVSVEIRRVYEKKCAIRGLNYNSLKIRGG